MIECTLTSAIRLGSRTEAYASWSNNWWHTTSNAPSDDAIQLCSPPRKQPGPAQRLSLINLCNDDTYQLLNNRTEFRSSTFSSKRWSRHTPPPQCFILHLHSSSTTSRFHAVSPLRELRVRRGSVAYHAFSHTLYTRANASTMQAVRDTDDEIADVQSKAVFNNQSSSRTCLAMHAHINDVWWFSFVCCTLMSLNRRCLNVPWLLPADVSCRNKDTFSDFSMPVAWVTQLNV